MFKISPPWRVTQLSRRGLVCFSDGAEKTIICSVAKNVPTSFVQIATISSSGCVNFVIWSSCRRVGGYETVKMKKPCKGKYLFSPWITWFRHQISFLELCLEVPDDALVLYSCFLTRTTRNDGEYFAAAYRVFRCGLFYRKGSRQTFICHPNNTDKRWRLHECFLWKL